MTSNNVKLRKIDYGSARRQSFGKMITDIYNEIPESATMVKKKITKEAFERWALRAKEKWD